jgi:signal transduction histidine kinase
VRDNGCGFDATDTNRSGFGLLGMNERAISLHGEFALHSVPGEGTVVSIYLPLQQEVSV